MVKSFVRQIDEVLTPGRDDEKAMLLTDMLIGFSALGGDENIVRKKSAVYLDAVDEFPLWALQHACRRWNKGLGITGKENFSFPPKPPELAILARSAVEVFRAKRNQATQLLTVEVIAPIDEDERQRISEKMVKFAEYNAHLRMLKAAQLKLPKGHLANLNEFPTFEEFCEAG